MMEEMFPKVLEYGILGVINIILLLKGIPALNELTKSISALADKVGALDDKVNRFENRLDKLETRMENSFKEIRDLIERRFTHHDKSVH